MGVVRNLMVRGGANFSGITKEAQRAKNSMTGMRKGFEKEFSGIKTAANGLKKTLGVLGVAVSFGAIVNGAKEARQAFAEVEESEAKLAQVMRNTMGATAQDVGAVKALIQEQQRLGVIEDAVQTAGAQELATYLGQVKSLKALLPVMNDMVAQQYGLNATQEQAVSIATMLGKVMQGQTGGLSRYGYYFSEAQAAILKYGTEEQRVATLAAVVEESVGGMNAALAATPSGRLKQVENSLGNIKESFGQAVTTLLTAFLPALQGLISLLDGVAAVANRVAQSIANVFGAKVKTNGAAIAGTVGAASSSMEGLRSATEGTVAAANKLRTAGFDTLQKLSGGSSGGGSAATDLGGGVDVGTALGGWEISDEASESIGWLENGLKKLKDTIGSINFEPLKESLGRLKDSCSGLAGIIGGYLRDAWNNVLVPLGKWFIEDAAPETVELLKEVIDDLARALERLRPIIAFIETAFVKVFQFVGDTVITVAQIVWDTLTWITQALTGHFAQADETLWKIADDFRDLFNIPAKVFPKFISTLDNLLNRAVNSVKSAVDKIKSFISNVKTAISGISLSGFSISGLVKSPHLADGAVLQPMHPFTAVVGDQRSGINVESPLSTITDAMMLALDSRGGYGGDDIEDILEQILAAVKAGRHMTVSGRVLGQSARQSLNDLARVTG